MSDNRRVYHCIKEQLKQLHPKQLKGNAVRHLTTLALLVAGMVQGRTSYLESISRHAPDGTKVASREKKLSRFLKNEAITPELYFLPFIELLLKQLTSQGSLTLIMDGSETGRRCLTLMISVVYQNRAIPLVWLTVMGNKGHLPEELHLKLVSRVAQLLPSDQKVVFLGDGEFDGLQLLALLEKLGWAYVCRTASNRQVSEAGDWFALNELGLKRGQRLEIPEAFFTQEEYGPVLVIGWWHKKYREPLYLVTNLECGQEACWHYRFRFRIETFFSDQKSRGFNLQKSHLDRPERVERFLIGSCLAYIWIIYLGVQTTLQGMVAQIHRSKRCDLSLFQLGLRFLDHLLNHNLPLLFGLTFFDIKCVR